MLQDLCPATHPCETANSAPGAMLGRAQAASTASLKGSFANNQKTFTPCFTLHNLLPEAALLTRQVTEAKHSQLILTFMSMQQPWPPEGLWPLALNNLGRMVVCLTIKWEGLDLLSR